MTYDAAVHRLELQVTHGSQRRGAPCALAAAILMGACAARGEPAAEPSPPEIRALVAPTSAPHAAERSDLPAGWDTLSPFGFERAIAAWSEAAGAVVFTTESLATLSTALAGQDRTAVRAAVLLAYCRTPGATRVLLERLEQRAEAPSRPMDAGDVVAAAALAGRAGDSRVPERLEALVVGERPHPDLEVRVECARSALLAGREAVIPWLLSVLRAMTHDEALAPPDWTPTQTLAWAKTRAAEALSLRAGVECAFRPDGSVAHQAAEARRLEGLLAR